MPNCFVVMGFGEKTDFQQNKTFDLDKSYQYIIKPAVEAAGYTCVRADEIQHAGNINVPMYEQLYDADLVIADLSTANLNAFFELGVRYGLKPRTTILIAENGLKMPFDIGQVVIRHYEHLGKGIDYGEVQRMKTELSEACTAIAKADRADSPVYTFLTNLTPPALKQIAAAAAVSEQRQTEKALSETRDEHEKTALTLPFAALMQSAMAARAKGDFKTAREILGGIRAVQDKNVDSFVLQQLALATYKSKDLDARVALLEARAIVGSLAPETSSDPETLGIWGAIHKRLFDLGGAPELPRLATLDTAIRAYEKGFSLKNDYYNGINFAFLLDTRAAESTGDDRIADHVQARRIRSRVLALCEALLETGIRGESARSKAEEEYWVRATRVEALLGLGRLTEVTTAFDEAKNMAPEGWMVEATESQLAKLRPLLAPGDADARQRTINHHAEIVAGG
jgi:tetratricopeptide (TPR) repeat protein